MRTYLETAVRPGTEFHETSLRIEGEVADVNLTVGFEYGWWIPTYMYIKMMSERTQQPDQ